MGCWELMGNFYRELFFFNTGLGPYWALIGLTGALPALTEPYWTLLVLLSAFFAFVH